MNQTNEPMNQNVEEAIAIKAFRIKLAMARINITKRSATGLSEAANRDSSGHLVGEFDISNLPMPIKKHIITAGIIQGDIFQYGDGFASVKEVTSSQDNSTTRKTLHLRVKALTPKSFEMAVGVVEKLMDEMLDPQKKTVKALIPNRSWSRVLKNEFEIQYLMKPVISHLITKGIIEGELYQSSGAVVNAKGSPYLAEDLPQEALLTRRIYLLIQGPNDKALYWAVNAIKQLIKEAEEIINNDIPQVVPRDSVQPSKEQDLKTSEANVLDRHSQPGVDQNKQQLPPYSQPGVDQNKQLPPYSQPGVDQNKQLPPYSQPGVDQNKQWPPYSQPGVDQNKQLPPYSQPGVDQNKQLPPYPQPGVDQNKQLPPYSQPGVDQKKLLPPFMPHLGQNVDADVQRCVVLVQWLLAHPLLVSFMACPPKGLKSTKVNNKLVATLLLSLPLYDQYKCSHSVSKNNCAECHKFYSNAKTAVHQCCNAVVSSGYDISNLTSVDDYIKDLAAYPEDIGVLYDYPLPLNLFYIDHCRLLIDFVVNYGLELEEHRMESYLKSTPQWYPVEAFQKIVVCSRIRPNIPSKNRKTHQYPLYCSVDHHGGLINFHLGTIGNASPGRLFPADAPKIPRCKYFPFLNRLSVFSKLSDYNKKFIDAPEQKTAGVSGSISQAAYQMTKSDPYSFSTDGSASQSQLQPRMKSRFDIPPVMSRSSLPPAMSGSSLPPVMSGSSVPPLMSGSSLPPAMSGSSLPRVMSGSSVPPLMSGSSVPPLMSGSSLPPVMSGSSVPTLMSGSSVPPPQMPELSTLSSTSTLNNPFWNNQILLEKQPNPYGDALSGGLENPSQAFISQNTFPNPQNLFKSSQHSETLKSVLPPSFLTMQEPKVKNPPPPNPNSNSSSNPNRIYRKQIRKAKADKKKEEKQEEIKKTIEVLRERYGTNSFWTLDLESEAEKAQEKLTSLLVPSTNAYNLDFKNTQPQAPGCSMQLLTGSPFPQNLQQVLSTMQHSMPSGTTLFGAQPTSLMRQESDHILKPPLLNPQQILGSQQSNEDDSKLSQDSSQENTFSEVINKLQEYIQATSTTATDSFVSGAPSTSVDVKMSARPQESSGTVLQNTWTATSMQQDASSGAQSTASGDSPEDTQFSSIIQQLQQYIDSKSNTSPGDDLEKKTPSGDQFQKKVEPVFANKSKETQQTWAKPESSQLKRPSTEPTSESNKAKRVYIEFANTKPTTPETTSREQTSQSTLQRQSWGKEVPASQKPSTSVQKKTVETRKIFSSVSILGDSLLKRARLQFGGSDSRDRRKDWFNLAKLTSDVRSYHHGGGKLNPYCVVMCGANDIINSIPQKDFVKRLKNLLNFLLGEGYYVLLVTLPLVISESMDINKTIPIFNGFIMSFNTKPNLSIIPFHRLSQEVIDQGVILHNLIHVPGKTNTVVLSNIACRMVRDLIEKEVPDFIDPSDLTN